MKFHQFSSLVERLDTGLRMHVIPVPDALSSRLGEHHRVLIEISGQIYRRALQSPKSGDPYVMLGQSVLKELGLSKGDAVEVGIATDPEPDKLDIPEELLEALEQAPKAKTRWTSFTPGKQRSLAHYVTSAKRENTRIRRAVELAEKIETHRLYGD